MIEIINSNIFLNIALIITSILNLYIILYNLAVKTLYIICLYFIEDYYIIFAFLIVLIRQII